MNKLTIMESSVRKWERIIAGKGSDGGVLDCPPCRIFYMLACSGCPIAEHTGKRFCKASPYPRWHYHQMDVHGRMRKRIYCPECLQLAKEMHALMVEIVAALKAASHAEEESRVDRR